MAEEHPSDIAPTSAEENPSDITSITAEENCLDVKTKMAEEESDIFPIAAEENPSDVMPPRSEEKSSDVTSMTSEAEKDIPEIHEIIQPQVETSRRYSTGMTRVSDGKLCVRPRYLGNSVSSCHDLCKYGVKHNDAVKPWKLVRKKKVELQSEGGDSEKAETLAVRRNKLSDGFKPTPVSKPEKPDKPATRHSLLFKKPNVSVKPTSSKEVGVDLKCARGSLPPKGGSSDDNGDKMEKSKEIEDSSTEVSVTRKGESKSGKQRSVGLRNEKKGVISPAVSLSPKLSIKRVSRFSPKNINGVSPSNDLDSIQKTKSDQANREDVPEKTLYVVESSIEKKSVKVAQSKIQRGPSPSSSGKKIMRSGPNGVNARQQPPNISPSPKDKGSRTTKSEPQLMKQTSKTRSSRSSSGYEHRASNSLNRESDSKPENNNRPKRIGIKLTAPQKMNFRKGKVVDIKQEDSIPRRLKFKRRVLYENPNEKGDGKKRNFKNKEDGDGKTNAGEVKREKVVLRHRKAEGKKELQTLFNNVIEETATKLAEARKSKVKALVGAFETVISLQDNKTSQKVRRHSSVSMAKG